MSQRGELARGLASLLLLTAYFTTSTPAKADVFVAEARGEKKPRSPQEQRRRKLLEEMGLHPKNEPTPVPPQSLTPPSESVVPDRSGNAANAAAGQPSSPGTPGAKGSPDDTPGTSQEPRPAALPVAPSFRRVIHPSLMQTCKPCHVTGGPAGLTSFVLSGDAELDRSATARFVDLGAPAASALLAKTSGQKPHGGGAPWPAGGAAYGHALAWIQAGARLDAAPRSMPTPPIAAGVSPPPSTATPSKALHAGPPARPSSVMPAPGTTIATQGPSQASPAQSAEPEMRPSSAAMDEATMVPTADSGSVPKAERIDFGTEVHPLLMHTCAACHSPVGPAAATRLVLSGDVSADYVKVRGLVNPDAPAKSPLIAKSIGQIHAGGAVISASSVEYRLLVAWVSDGAQGRAATPVVAQTGSAPTEPSAGAGVMADAVLPLPEAVVPATGHPGDTVSNAGPAASSLPGALPYGLAINGRFDLAYERRGFSGNPFDDGATDVLRSYHHFLFLSRDVTDDPVGLAVEMLSLQFWEAHLRWRAKEAPIQIAIAAGKVLVPFGGDPLMHQSYGGLAGFDQRMLPPIWAQYGLAVHLVGHRRELALTDDLYVVRGYALRQADAVINLQNDFSPEDDVHLGWGNRLGAAWGPLSGWYSIYYNPLGFGRRLVMQAGDVMLWRLRGLPVLGHFSFAAGLMRADVSGGDEMGTGGAGKDYYHFGSYFQVRYHPTDWFYLQYRQGLHTFNNRRGTIVDDTRLTRDDGSTHNFGAVARYRGLTAGLYYFINLEKADEIPDDFLRASVTYDF